MRRWVAVPALVLLALGAAALYVAVNDEGGPLLPGDTVAEPDVAEDGFRLEQNQPNPFGETTVIGYRLPAEERVTLQVYNTLGAPVATLVDGVRGEGLHRVTWDGRDRNGNRLPAGVYFYQLGAGDRQALRRLVLLPSIDG
jgi:hypothetical protein